ncbi:Cell wall integrity protein scw1 [Bienertia sinuspersici]
MEDMAAYYHPPPPQPPQQLPQQPPQLIPSDIQSTFYTSHYHPPPPLSPPLHHSHPRLPPSLTTTSHLRRIRILRTTNFALFSSPAYPTMSSLAKFTTSFATSWFRLFQSSFSFVKVFSDQQSAVTAMHALNGMVFDLEKGSTLYIDLAKSNSRSKRQRTDDEGPASDKKRKGSPAFQRGSGELGIGSYHIPGMTNSVYNTIGYPSAQSHWSYNSGGAGEATAAKSSHSSTYVPQDNPPCPTIFVANLGPNSSERELTQVFSRCRGFLKLKIQGTYGAPVAFVDFQDTACSTEALNQLQGTVFFFIINW